MNSIPLTDINRKELLYYLMLAQQQCDLLIEFWLTNNNTYFVEFYKRDKINIELFKRLLT